MAVGLRRLCSLFVSYLSPLSFRCTQVRLHAVIVASVICRCRRVNYWPAHPSHHVAKLTAVVKRYHTCLPDYRRCCPASQARVDSGAAACTWPEFDSPR